MADLSTLIDRAGFRRRVGAAPSAIARQGSVFQVRLPDEFVELWTLSDGMDGDGIEVLSLAGIEKYAGVFAGGFGYVPFTDTNDSNPYCFCCDGPLRGVVAHVCHDDEPELVCRGLRRFLELVAESKEHDTVDRISGELSFDVANRTDADLALSGALVLVAESMERDDEWRGTALRFAAQLLGSGHEKELAHVMAIGDEYTREAVRQRYTAVGTPEARRLLREDDDAYRKFLVDLRQAFEAAGVQTETDRREGFRLQLGRIGINFVKLYADCRRPGAMAEWVQRFKERIGDK